MKPVRFITMILFAASLRAADAAAGTAASRPADPCVQRATAGAFAELAVRLLRLPMTDRETVGQWIGARTDVELALRRAAYECHQVKVISGALPDASGSPSGSTLDAPSTQSAAPNVCRVEVSVVVSEMARAWARGLRQGSLASLEELEQIRQWSIRADQGRLSIAGTSQRMRPAPVTSQPGASEEDEAPNLPAGWEHLPPEALDVARQAAAADAAERMRARCRDLRLGAGESLGDVFDLYGQFEDAFLKQMERRLDGQPIYEPFGVCRIPSRLSLKDIAAVLSQAASETPNDVGLAPLEFTPLSRPGQGDSIAVEGVGTPPPARLAWAGRSASNEAPSWATETLTAIGQSDPSVDEESTPDPTHRRLDAVARARLDAIRNMWLQVDELVLPDGRRVREVILSHPEVASDLNALERRMRDADEPEVTSEGRASVKLVMPLGPLWDAISRVAGGRQGQQGLSGERPTDDRTAPATKAGQ